jgi:hypothetical protein
MRIRIPNSAFYNLHVLYQLSLILKAFDPDLDPEVRNTSFSKLNFKNIGFLYHFELFKVANKVFF